MNREEFISNLSTANELYHHGVKGQKWGVRRYQNADRTRTSEGKKHYKLSDKQKTALKVTGAIAGTAAVGAGIYFIAKNGRKIDVTKSINAAKKTMSQNNYLQKNINNIQKHVDPGKKFMNTEHYQKMRHVHLHNASLSIKADKTLWGKDVSKRDYYREGLNSQLKWLEDTYKHDVEKIAKKAADKEYLYDLAIRRSKR